MSFSISNNETTILFAATTKAGNPLTSDIDANNLDVTNMEFMNFNLQSSPGASPAGTLSLYSNTDDTFHVVNAAGTDTSLGSAANQSLNTTDDVEFFEVAITDASTPTINFLKSSVLQWSMIYVDGPDDFLIQHSSTLNVVQFNSALQASLFDIVTPKITTPIYTYSGGLGSVFNIGTSTTNPINFGKTGTSTTILGNTVFAADKYLKIGSDTTITDNKSINLLLQSSATIAAGILVTLIDNSGPKVTSVLSGDVPRVPIVGVTVDAATGIQDIRVAIEGVVTVTIDGLDTISPGDPLKKSGSQSGYVGLGVEGTDRIIARALTGSAGGPGAQIQAIFVKKTQF